MADRARRFPAKYPVVLRQGPEMFPATICNISIGGGCIIGGFSLKKGETVMVDYAIGQTRATVMWTMARMAGLKFDTELSSLGLNYIRALHREAS